MRSPLSLITIVCLPALFTGCVGTGPSTQQGAVTGGALGALAGGIIGNNSRGGDTFGGALLGATVGALAGGVMGNSVDQQRGTVYDDPPVRTYRRAVVMEPPPPPPTPTETVGPAPAPSAVWVPGYWLYDGRGYRWNAGHWEVPPPNAQNYVAGHWEQQANGSYVYVPGAAR